MTPNDALESMDQLRKIYGDKLGEKFNIRAWPEIIRGLQTAVHFEFGMAAPAPEHHRFAEDLIEKGLYRLPYSTVFMTGNCSPKTGLLCMNSPDDTKHPLTVVIFSTCNIADLIHLPAGPLFAAACNQERNVDGLPTFNWTSLTYGDHKSRKTGLLKDDEDLENSVLTAVALAMDWPVLLMSKDVETIKLEAPDRLNRARALKGKLPIRERMIVRIRPEARERQRQALIDHRASPKMHWRRGHFRQLHEKHGGSIIPIAPQIINADPNANPIKKTYKLG